MQSQPHYDFSKMTLCVWQDPIFHIRHKPVRGWRAKWVVDPRDALRHNLRESKTFGGIGRTEGGVRREAQWWMQQQTDKPGQGA